MIAHAENLKEAAVYRSKLEVYMARKGQCLRSNDSVTERDRGAVRFPYQPGYLLQECIYFEIHYISIILTNTILHMFYFINLGHYLLGIEF